MTTLRLDGRVAVITGGGSGIGAATAKRLASEGAACVIVGRRRERLDEVVAEITSRDGRALAFDADVRTAEASTAIVAAAVDWGGRLDIVVNAAGSFPSSPFAEIPDAEWNDAIETNLTAPMRVARAAVPALRKRGGVIINVSSINAVIGDAASQCAHYTAAKAGLEGLTRQLAVELAPDGIRAVGVAPGAVDTELLEGWLEDPAERAVWFTRYVPIGRIATSEEIAGVLAFLASDDASYITGEIIRADGGMSIV